MRIPRASARRWAAAIAATSALAGAFLAARAPADTQGPFADFVEPDFPFVSTTLDARHLGPGFAAADVTTRAVVLQLGNESYAAFDPDLLRMSIGWRGAFAEMTTMAQVSYQEPNNKNNQLPKVLGAPVFVTGVYPGWSGDDPDFRDPRPPGPNPADPGRGPVSTGLGRWNGLHLAGGAAVLAYSVLGTEILEQPGSVRFGDEVGFTRAFRTGPIARPLTLVAAEVAGASRYTISGSTVVFQHGEAGDTLTAIGVVGAPRGATLQVSRYRYVTLRLPAGRAAAPFRVVIWRGPASKRAAFARMLRGPTRMAEVAEGGPARWRETEVTRGTLSPDTAAYVVDRIALPIPNRWRRNVRVSDVDFFSDGRAAVVTFEGDVWIVDGLDADLGELRWKRFSSGLYEPMSLQVVGDRVYVYSRDGIVRLDDRNGDGEADFYENFSNLPHQSSESREFPLSMDEKPGGGFYLTRGGALDNGPRTSPAVAPGFRAGSAHAGTVMEISADGRRLDLFATGLREPFLAVHPVTGLVAASDQQGNFVPSTPVYLVPRGGYHGVLPTAHRADPPAETPPLAWIPHAADRSASGQVWVTGDRMGFGGDALVHLSYGRPGAFRVYADSASGTPQGAVVSLLPDYPDPVMKGEYNPRDNHLYLAGFQVWDTNAKSVAGFNRVRYTGRPSPLPLEVRAGAQGILLRFATALDRTAATDPARYRLQRWNYRRTSAYGSGNFRADGAPGRDTLSVAAAHLSADGRSLLLLVPDMREAMQLELGFDLRTAAGGALRQPVYLTLHRAAEMDLGAAGFPGLDWRASIASAAPRAAPSPVAAASAALGAQLYQRVACAGCHALDAPAEARMGPPLRGVFGSVRTFADGSTRVADEAYLRQSLLDPSSQIVGGYADGMPSYQGVLNETEIESLVLYVTGLPH